MNVELYLKGIRMTHEALKKDLERVHTEISELREQCPHTNAAKTYHINSGNYDLSADCDWYEFNCPDCGKHWEEDA